MEIHELAFSHGLRNEELKQRSSKCTSNTWGWFNNIESVSKSQLLALDADTFLGGALVNMNGKCWYSKSAKKVFFRLTCEGNVLISGYSQKECIVEAFEAFHDMQCEQIRPNTVNSSINSVYLCSLVSHDPV